MLLTAKAPGNAAKAGGSDGAASRFLPACEPWVIDRILHKADIGTYVFHLLEVEYQMCVPSFVSLWRWWRSLDLG